MKRFILLFVLLMAVCSSVWASIGTGNTSPFVQSATGANNSTSVTCPFHNNVTNGNRIVVGTNWETGTADPTVTDTRSTSYSKIIKDTSGSVKGALYIGTLGSGGANTVTVAETSGSFMQVDCMEIPASIWSATVDVSDSKVVSSTPATPAGNAVTTTVNGELLIGHIGGFSSSGLFNIGSGFQMVGNRRNQDSSSMEYLVTGAPGSNTVSFKNTSNSTVTVFTAALKPNALTITDAAALPDAALSTAYSYCLHAIGGTGASYTWTITVGGLQPGLSLNSTTGCITGTPTFGPQNSITFQVNDGVTTATLATTLKVGNSMNTIAHVQDTNTNNSTTAVFPSNVTSGNLEVVFGYPINPDGGNGISYPVCTDTRLTPLQFIGAILGGTDSSGAAVMWAGIVPSTGANTVTCTLSAYEITSASEFSNVYAGLSDLFGLTQGTGGGATYTSNSLATLVANQLLVATGAGFTSATVLTASSPFTGGTGTSSLHSLPEWRVVTTATGYTAAFTVTSNTSGNWGIVLAGFRPTANGTAPGPASSGVWAITQ